MRLAAIGLIAVLVTACGSDSVDESELPTPVPTIAAFVTPLAEQPTPVPQPTVEPTVAPTIVPLPEPTAEDEITEEDVDEPVDVDDAHVDDPEIDETEVDEAEVDDTAEPVEAEPADEEVIDEEALDEEAIHDEAIDEEVAEEDVTEEIAVADEIDADETDEDATVVEAADVVEVQPAARFLQPTTNAIVPLTFTVEAQVEGITLLPFVTQEDNAVEEDAVEEDVDVGIDLPADEASEDEASGDAATEDADEEAAGEEEAIDPAADENADTEDVSEDAVDEAPDEVLDEAADEVAAQNGASEADDALDEAETNDTGDNNDAQNDTTSENEAGENETDENGVDTDARDDVNDADATSDEEAVNDADIDASESAEQAADEQAVEEQAADEQAIAELDADELDSENGATGHLFVLINMPHFEAGESVPTDDGFIVPVNEDGLTQLALAAGTYVLRLQLTDSDGIALAMDTGNGAEAGRAEIIVAVQPDAAEQAVRFAMPSDGAVVPPEFDVAMAATGLTIEPIGAVREGAGHFHILVNEEFVEPGEIIATDETNLHFGAGQLTTTLTLEPGEHVLRLQLADGFHTALEGEEYRDEITVTVEEDTPRNAVMFLEPRAGDEVESPFTARWGAAGLLVEPIGAVLDEGRGHFHILVDEDFIEPGVVIPTDDTHLHFGAAQMETELSLEPGEYTLRLQMANGAHIALEGDEYRDEITITVSEADSVENGVDANGADENGTDENGSEDAAADVDNADVDNNEADNGAELDEQAIDGQDTDNADVEEQEDE